MNKLIIILVLTLTIGCNRSENKSQAINQEETDTTSLTPTNTYISTQESIKSDGSDRLDIEPGEPEQFDNFFKNYTTDSIFQFKRTLFPVEQRYWEIGEDEPTSENVNKSQWRFATFYYHDSIATRQVDAYTQTINYGQDTTKLELRGVDNGIYVDYNFANKDGRWFLVSIHDYSN